VCTKSVWAADASGWAERARASYATRGCRGPAVSWSCGTGPHAGGDCGRKECRLSVAGTNNRKPPAGPAATLLEQEAARRLLLLLLLLGLLVVQLA
jgi:hypothetical protein